MRIGRIALRLVLLLLLAAAVYLAGFARQDVSGTEPATTTTTCTTFANGNGGGWICEH